MEILGIGAPELVFIIIIVLIVLGPKDMQKAGRTIGRWLNTLVHSDNWRVFQKTSRELRNLPSNLMREANLEMIKADEDIRKAIKPDFNRRSEPGNRPQGAQDHPIQPRAISTPSPAEVPNRIQPPRVDPEEDTTH